MNEQEAANAMGAACGAIMVLIMLVSVIAALIGIIGMWKTFSKAGQPGWAAIIPIYNVLVMLNIAGKPWWFLILYFVPIANLIVTVLTFHGIALAFGRGIGTTLGLIFLGPVFWLILGFGSAEYQGAPE